MGCGNSALATVAGGLAQRFPPGQVQLSRFWWQTRGRRLRRSKFAKARCMRQTCRVRCSCILLILDAHVPSLKAYCMVCQHSPHQAAKLSRIQVPTTTSCV